MNYTVPSSTIICIVIAMVAGIILPVAAAILAKKKTTAKLSAFFTGCGIMLVFAFILEQILHTVVLMSSVGSAITGNIWLYGLYGGLAAGLFEETGRFFAFKVILKKDHDNDGTALMYGAGHGGFEAFYILVIGMVNNLIYAALLNSGMAQTVTASLTGDALVQVEAVFEALATTASPIFLVGIAERMIAMVAHVGMSVLVWFAAKKGGKATLLYPLSILLHATMNFIAVAADELLGNVVVVEGAILVVALGIVFVASKVWKANAKAE